MFGRKSTEKKQRRYFSLAFLLAIPGNFIFSAAALMTFLLLVRTLPFNRELWSLFFIGVIGGWTIIGTRGMTRLRVTVHELKHAVVVGLTGNVVRAIKIQKESGHVDYEMYAETLRFAPLIALAPYFFPLFSAPALLGCLLLEDLYRNQLTVMLGFCLATDLATAYGELHPGQTDFHQVVGGFAAAAAYLAGFHITWTTICLLWIAAGRNSYIFAGNVVWELVRYCIPG